ncbi:MAG: cobyric acid synthase [Candidatus Nanohalobium sp.]
MAEWISVQGTRTGVGKSTLVASVCRELKSRGYSVAPFKPVNYSLNSFPVEGTEIGYMSNFQWKVAGADLSKDINPVLVKFIDDKAEVVTDKYEEVDVSNLNEFIKSKEEFITRSAERLDRKYDCVVMEGYGSLVKSNLDYNFNSYFLKKFDPSTVLVGDSSLGGVEASLKGCLELVDKEVEETVDLLIVNKIHPDSKGKEKLRQEIKEKTSVETCLIEYKDRLNLPPEDSTPELKGSGEITVIDYPNSSNSSDLWKLPEEKTAKASTPEDIRNAELVILPGSKNVFQDLKWLREKEFDKALEDADKILGICGGLQILGEKIEGNSIEEGSTKGLGLIDLETGYSNSKTLKQVETTVEGEKVQGYEIHYGDSKTELLKEEGLFYRSGDIIGTYVHDLLASEPFLNKVLKLSGLEKVETTGPGLNQLDEETEKILEAVT